MKGIKNFYMGAFFIASAIVCSCFIGQKIFFGGAHHNGDVAGVVDTSMGSFLAAQHALYVNDFDSATEFISGITDDVTLINEARSLTEFLGGKMPTNAKSMKDAKDLTSRFIYDAYLISNDDWKSVYKRHSKDASILLAPLRIFSGVQQGKKKEILKFIDSLPTNDSWKSFVRGQIAVLNKDIDKAAKEFANVHPDFMNINDYLYLMSFYRENEMFEDMEILRNDFVSKPGGMYIFDYDGIPDWSNYDGYKNNLMFNIVQTVSHTQIMIYTDLSLMMLRFAQSISNETNIDAVNYYLGQYYFNNAGDYEKSFSSISKESPLYLFGQMKIAEKKSDFKSIKKIAKENPLFVPAVNSVVADCIKRGDKSGALKIINKALKQKEISDLGKIYFLKQRANVYLMFDLPKKAQKDLDTVFSMDDRLLPDIVMLQARAWNQQNINLDDAYDYVMSLIKVNTSNVIAWDVLSLIIDKREGTEPALEVLERIAGVAFSVSSVYEHLGDLYKKQGYKSKALDAYLRAVDLSGDGLVVVPVLNKKIRKVR